ncbi:MAG TPA: aspartate--tRNA ligase [bacterium]
MKNRTYCGTATATLEGRQILLCGWMHRVRDLGGVAFFDLRDHTGLVQVTPDPQNQALKEMVTALHHEDVLRVVGKVRRRPKGSENPRLATGDIEVLAAEIELLSPSKTPPFLPEEAEKVQEDLRLKHRVIHLRSEKMQRHFRLRHKLYLAIRHFFDENGFIEVETPFLVKPTPEGARDFLVPSRLHPGRAYALPQSPQIYKQLLMVAGFDRYFQIVKCFRDEDLRADRQPEFSQIDVELSFTDEQEVQEIVEGLMARVFLDALGVKIETPFERIPYHQAMKIYGSDKPDLRNPLKIADLTEAFSGTEFRIFSETIKAGGAIRSVTLPGCAGYSRKQRDVLIEMAKGWGLGGLVYIQIHPDMITSSAAKFLSEGQMKRATEAAGAATGDLLAIGADANVEKLALGLGQLRNWAGKELKLSKEGDFKHCWVTEFPMFEFNPELRRYQAAHHPFTSPVLEDLQAYPNEPGKIRARAYDLVLNGHEIAGGSIRIHQREVQRKVFELLGFTPEEAQAKFGFLLEALELGAPPHGGIAFGLDRMAMIMVGADSIRDVIPFPKTTAALSLMDGSPAQTSDEQWGELGLKRILESHNPANPTVGKGGKDG